MELNIQSLNFGSKGNDKTTFKVYTKMHKEKSQNLQNCRTYLELTS